MLAYCPERSVVNKPTLIDSRDQRDEPRSTTGLDRRFPGGAESLIDGNRAKATRGKHYISIEIRATGYSPLSNSVSESV